MTRPANGERCETCAYQRPIPSWRKRQRTSKLEATAKVVECVRFPLTVVKLETEHCGEFAHTGEGGRQHREDRNT